MGKLTKSQRVTIIREVAARLDADDWTTIDLTLKQFAFTTSDQWSGGKAAYVVDMIGSGEDEDLIELAEHFGIDVGSHSTAKDSAPSSPFWEEGKVRTFISHLSSEKKQAAEIQSDLSRFGMSAFVAHKDIHPTLEWQIEIESALATCDLLVALLHPKFIESQWCDQEIGYALGRGIPVFTIRCGADPYGFVSRFQGFDGNGKTSLEIAGDIFNAALIHKKLQTKLAGIIVNMFIGSGAFSTAKVRMGYLEKWATLKSCKSGTRASLIVLVEQQRTTIKLPGPGAFQTG